MIEVGQWYQHYKGGTYEIVAIARHTTTEETLVVYRHVDNATEWARPINDFHDIVEHAGPRFTRVR